MPTVTIPRKTIKEADLILIPRKEYEDLLRIRKKNGGNIVVKHTMKVPKKHEKFYEKLDKELTAALREYSQGKYYGPFETAEEAIRSLNRKR